MSIDFKKSLKSKEDLPWDELFKLSVARQLNLCHTPEELRRMNIDHEKLIKTELTLALRQRELNPEEKSKVEEAILTLGYSPEQRLLDAISDASYTPKTSFQRVKSIIEEGGANVNLEYKEFSFLVMAAGVYKNQGLEIIQFLLDHGADPNIQDDDGKTPLDRAMKKRKEIEDETERQKFDEALNELHLLIP
ncbi:MAG: ankyrin repeat domain-containing protein [Puniceicoccales bacterium]|jgi:hypothetical protein|nr:ankyrin repeat domain-containing protein [Puniceicoccales bacterium]